MTEQPALTENEVLAATDELMNAFRQTDCEAYFACFTSDATFVFPDQDARLENRVAYEHLWAEWVASGWQVLECTSTDRRVQLAGDTAVLSHTVRTRIATGEDEGEDEGENEGEDDGEGDGGRTGTDELHERETIVFHRQAGGRLLAVHEHLSGAPAAAG